MNILFITDLQDGVEMCIRLDYVRAIEKGGRELQILVGPNSENDVVTATFKTAVAADHAYTDIIEAWQKLNAEITDEEVDFVMEVVRSFYKKE